MANERFGRIRLTHVNLDDGTAEGFAFLDVPAFSVQYLSLIHILPYEQVAFMHRDPITLTNQLEAFTDFFRAHADTAA